MYSHRGVYQRLRMYSLLVSSGYQRINGNNELLTGANIFFREKAVVYLLFQSRVRGSENDYGPRASGLWAIHIAIPLHTMVGLTRLSIWSLSAKTAMPNGGQNTVGRLGQLSERDHP